MPARLHGSESEIGDATPGTCLFSAALPTHWERSDPAANNMMLQLLRATVWLSVILPSQAAGLASTGRTATLNGIHYYVSPESVGRLDGAKFRHDIGDGLLPLTVTSTNKSSFGLDELTTLTERYENDDVWQEAFLEGKHIVEQYGRSITDGDSAAHPKHKC